MGSTVQNSGTTVQAATPVKRKVMKPTTPVAETPEKPSKKPERAQNKSTDRVTFSAAAQQPSMKKIQREIVREAYDSQGPQNQRDAVRQQYNSQGPQNQREMVEALYENKIAAEEQAQVRAKLSNAPENVRENIKRMYEGLEADTAIQERLRQESMVERGNVRKEQQLRVSMARDKAEAMRGQLFQLRRDVLETQKSTQEDSWHALFEASKATEADQKQMSIEEAKQAKERFEKAAFTMVMNRTVSSEQAKDDSNRRQIADENAKIAQSVGRRLDQITPGAFEKTAAAEVSEKPNIGITDDFEAKHQIEVDRQTPSVERDSAHRKRVEESLAHLDSTLDASEAGSHSRDSINAEIEKVRSKARASGVQLLDNTEETKKVVRDALEELQNHPTAALKSQSRVSVQAAMALLQ